MHALAVKANLQKTLSRTQKDTIRRLGLLAATSEAMHLALSRNPARPYSAMVMEV